MREPLTDNTWRAWAWVVVGAVWVVILARLIPSVLWDRGIFVSVAERLIAGDKLYIGVWDNKDPLFYYLGALTRLVSPYADIVLEVAWVVLACWASWLLCRGAKISSTVGVVLAFGAVPLVLTGPLYWPGYTELRGVSMTLLIFAAAARSRWLAAGILLGLLAFMKLTMLPLAVALMLTVYLVNRDLRGLLRTIAGAIIGAATVAAVLVVRGEALPFLKALQMNVGYASSRTSQSALPAPLAHLDLVLTPPAQTSALACVVLIVGAYSVGRAATPMVRALWWGAASTLAVGIGVLSIVGLWDHHSQILYVAAVLALMAAACAAGNWSGLGTARSAALVLIFAVLLGGMLDPRTYWRSWLTARETVTSLTRISPEARALLSIGPSGTYARLGQNDDLGHAYGLGGWTLACPRFAQYLTDPPAAFEGLLPCIKSVDVVIASSSGRAFPSFGSPQYNKFYSEVEPVLAADFVCSWAGDFRVCVRN